MLPRPAIRKRPELYMIMRSISPVSAHLALMPVPAPPPTIGLPAATCARSRLKHSARVTRLIGILRVAYHVDFMENVWNCLASLRAGTRAASPENNVTQEFGTWGRGKITTLKKIV